MMGLFIKVGARDKLFNFRSAVEFLPLTGKVYYGHEIGTDLGELVHPDW